MSAEKKNSAFKAGIGYTIGNILIKGIGILTLPLFSRIMSTEEFGVYNVFMSYDAILFVVISLAMHTSVRSANLEFKDKVDDYVSSISLIYVINMVVFLIVVMLFGSMLSVWLGYEKTLLYMLVLYSFASSIVTLYNTRISLSYSYKQYLVVALVNSLGNVLLSLALILTVFRNKTDYGRILGTTAVTLTLAICLLVTFYRKAKPRVNGQYWGFALKYSLPVVPHGISQVLLAQFDRIMISKMVSDAAAGIYSLAGNIKLILTVITGSISTAWSTWFYTEMDRNNRGDIQKRAVQLSGLFTILTVGLMALSPELIYILGGAEYDQGKYVAIPMIVDAFVLFLYDVIVSGEYYTKKTGFIMLGTLVAAALNVILNYIFILKYGFIAAAYTTLFAYICYLVMHLIISRKLIGFFILPVKWVLIYSVIVAVMAAVDLVLTESLVWRWLLCAVVVIPIALALIKSLGGINALRKRENRG